MDHVEMFRNDYLNDNIKISEEIKHLIYDRDFLKKIQKQRCMVKEVKLFCRTIERNDNTLSEAVHLWLGIENQKSFHDNNMLSHTRILSYMLDHRYKGKRLPPELKFRASKLMMRYLKGGSEIIDDQKEYSKFLEYRGTEGQFNAELNALSCENYWKTFKDYCPKLSEMGLLYTSLPAAVYVNENMIIQMKDHQLYGENHHKAVFIHNFLKN